jgi:hypothetical protein
VTSVASSTLKTRLGFLESRDPFSDAVAAKSSGLISELTHLLQQATRITAKLVILLGQDRFHRVGQDIDLAGYFFVVFGRAGAANGFGEDLIERKLDVGIVEDVIVLDDHCLDRELLVHIGIDVHIDVNIDVNVHIDIDVIDLVFLADYFFVKTLGELFFIKNFVCVAITSHKIPSL